MLNLARWDYQINHYETLKDNRIYKDSIIGMNKSEYNECKDLEHRNDECFVLEARIFERPKLLRKSMPKHTIKQTLPYTGL